MIRTQTYKISTWRHVIALLALVTAVGAIFAPWGVSALTLIAGVFAAIAFRELPILSAVAFGVNFSNVAAHVPGYIYPVEAFAVQGFVVGPENMVHWGFFLFQVILMTAGFYTVLKNGSPAYMVKDVETIEDALNAAE